MRVVILKSPAAHQGSWPGAAFYRKATRKARAHRAPHRRGEGKKSGARHVGAGDGGAAGQDGFAIRKGAILPEGGFCVCEG
jgi:hypothetical protein